MRNIFIDGRQSLSQAKCYVQHLVSEGAQCGQKWRVLYYKLTPWVNKCLPLIEVGMRPRSAAMMHGSFRSPREALQCLDEYRSERTFFVR